MKLIAILTLSLLPCYLLSQSLGVERVKKIKSSIVRISIGDTATGTGFFINSEGDIATCWHVIANAVHQDYRHAYVFDKVQIKTETNEIDSADLYVYFLLNGFENSQVYDFCILKLVHPLKNKFSFLKLGDYKDINEGDQIYSCGYPLSYQQNFLSSGICSTKFKILFVILIEALINKRR